MGAAEVGKFPEHLAVDRKVSASTQNQALYALVFYYEKVLKRPLEGLQDVTRAKRKRSLPVVLSERVQDLDFDYRQREFKEGNLSSGYDWRGRRRAFVASIAASRRPWWGGAVSGQFGAVGAVGAVAAGWAFWISLWICAAIAAWSLAEFLRNTLEISVEM